MAHKRISPRTKPSRKYGSPQWVKNGKKMEKNKDQKKKNEK